MADEFLNQFAHYFSFVEKAADVCTIGTGLAIATKQVRDRIRASQEKRRTRDEHLKQIHAFIRNLGLTEFDCSACIGPSSAKLNPHDVAAATPVLHYFEQVNGILASPAEPLDLHVKRFAHAVTFGGASATVLAKVAHGFTGELGDLRINPEYYNMLPLRYYSIGSRQQHDSTDLHIIVRDSETGKPTVRRTWNTGIVDYRNSSKPYMDSQRADLTPSVFHLLITKTPNVFLTLGRSDPKLSFVSFDGSRGIATEALSMLFDYDNRELLSKINAGTNGADLFQIVLDVDVSEPGENEVHTATRINLASDRFGSEEHAIYKVRSVDPDALKSAREFVQNRFAYEQILIIGPPDWHTALQQRIKICG